MEVNIGGVRAESLGAQKWCANDGLTLCFFGGARNGNIKVNFSQLIQGATDVNVDTVYIPYVDAQKVAQSYATLTRQKR